MSLTAPELIPHYSTQLGADGVYYPSDEERIVPLTEHGLRIIVYLYQALQRIFLGQNLHVGADQFVYWEPGNIYKRIAPDVYVLRGIPQDPPLAVVRTWELGPPDLVIEISSPGSRSEDRRHKVETYQSLVRSLEYLVFDEVTDEVLFYRHSAGRYRLQNPDADGHYHSEALSISFAVDPEVRLRVFDRDGVPVPAPAEWAMEIAAHRKRAEAESRRAELENRRAEAESRRAEAESRRAEAESRRAEAESRRADDEVRRNELLQHELERLQAELKRLSNTVE